MANPTHAHRFHTTRWSIVRRASPDAGDSDSARGALHSLCETYWYPMYGWLRRQGTSSEDAVEQVQDFVAHLLERAESSSPLDAQPERGRFRSYLLTALQNHVSNMHRAAKTQKRGGGQQPLSINADDAGARYAADIQAAKTSDPDRQFVRSWAMNVIERAYAALEAEQTARNHGARFEALRDRLGGDGSAGTDYAEIGDRLGLSVSAVKVTVFRMRTRLRELIRDAVADTVDSAATETAIDEEVAALFDALAAD